MVKRKRYVAGNREGVSGPNIEMKKKLNKVAKRAVRAAYRRFFAEVAHDCGG